MNTSPELLDRISSWEKKSPSGRTSFDVDDYHRCVVEIALKMGMKVKQWPYVHLDGKEDFLVEILSPGSRGIVATRLLIHGEERGSGCAFPMILEEAVDYASERGVGFRAVLAGNPDGLRRGKRYSRDEVLAKRAKLKFCGNNDFIRHLVGDKWVDTLMDGYREDASVEWEWADKIENFLPAETRTMIEIVRSWNKENLRVAVRDFHRDNEINKGTYGFSPTGKDSHVQVLTQASKIMSVVRNTTIHGGDGNKAFVNGSGLIIGYRDGSFEDAAHHLGWDAVTAEVAINTLWKEEAEIQKLWIENAVDMLAK